MNAIEAQKKLKVFFSRIFGHDNVIAEWRSNARAQDWLKFGDIYAPRPDIAVGSFNIEDGANTSEIAELFTRNQIFFNQLEITNSHLNENPRCLIAIEIENSNKGKHMLGNIINTSLLGKVGIIVTLRDEYYVEAQRTYKYLKGAFDRKKVGHDPSNVVIKKYDELQRILRQNHRR